MIELYFAPDFWVFIISFELGFCRNFKGSADVKDSKRFKQWDSWTAKFSGASNIPFLLLQMPQIILNAQNLMAGNKTALLAVPWLVTHYRIIFIYLV